MAHAGSWFGLPDFGITESIGSLLGAPRTSQGGSNLSAGYSPPQTLVSPVPSGSTYGAGGSVQLGGGGVLGANTVYPTGGATNTLQQVTQQSSGGSSGGSSGPSYEDQMRQQIEGGYNNYFSQLDQMLNGLTGQKAAQEGLANTSYNTNLTDLGLQKESNQQALNTQKTAAQTNQVKTLKDVSSNIRNLMNAGNTYLGSMGAGDSSAVNQYAYGLTKLGSQQRGDVMSQTAQTLNEIAGRESNLNNIYMQEKNRLAGERDTKIYEIAQWFADAQNQLRQAKGSGELAKSADLQNLTTNMYNAAMQQLAGIQNAYAQRTATLEQWAANNATNLTQLKANMAQVANYQAQTPTVNPIGGTPQFAPQGTSTAPYGGAGFTGLTDEQKRLLGLA